MKKFYSLLILLFTASIAQAQWAGYNGNGTDNLWSNDANWEFGGPDGSVPTSITEQGLNISFYNGTTDVNLDMDYTTKRLRMAPAKSEDFLLTGTNLFTVDIASSDQENTDGNEGKAIWNDSDVATTLTIDCDVTIANSVTPEQFKGVSVISAKTDGSIIEFSSGKTLNITGTGTTSFWGGGRTNVNGNITGDKGILLGANAEVFFGSSSSDVSGYTGDITVAEAAELTLNANGSSTITNNKIQCNGTNAIITLNGENVVTPAEIRVSSKTNQIGRSVTLNINANQILNNLKMKAADSRLFLHIDPSVTSVKFGANNINAANWTPSSEVHIYGFKEGVVQFGANATSLNNGALLSNIKIFDDMGVEIVETLALDPATGNLYTAANLSVSKFNAFEFAVYPNPANDVIQVQTQELIDAAEVFDMLGKKVVQSQSIEQIDISNLTSGLYMLKLTAENGGIATKKIIKR